MTQDLLDEGIQKFADSYGALIGAISEKKVTAEFDRKAGVLWTGD